MNEVAPIEPKRVLATFLDLVKIDSPSQHEAAVAAYCTTALEECGCAVTIDDTADQTGSNTGNLIAALPGTALGRVCVCAHMDTVEPGRNIEPIIKDGYVFSQGDTILGADDKVGIAAILEALRVLSAHRDSLSYPQVDVLMTVQEERGLVGAKVLNLDGFEGEPCFVLDANKPPGAVVVKAPYQRSYTAVFKGRAAHAGIEPEKGISAIRAATTAVAALPFGCVDSETTTNTGTISGGTENNVVAERCTVTGECRSHQSSRLMEICSTIENTFHEASRACGTELELTWIDNYPGFSYAPDDPLVLTCLAAAEEIGLTPTIEVTGGGADTNVFVQKGLRAVTLATGMQLVHGTDERIEIRDLENLSRFLIALIMCFAR